MSSLTKQVTLFAILSLLLIGKPVKAEDWLVSGFATLGLSYIDDKDVFFSHPAKRRTKRPRMDFGADSVLGLQIERQLATSTSATLQLRSYDHRDRKYKPEVSWAFLRHELSPSTSIRAGRLRSPSFMYSESLDLNYAQPWVRPPIEVYGLHPMTEVDGIDVIFRQRFAGYDFELQPYAGAGGTHQFPNGRARLSSHSGVSLGIERGKLTVRLGHSTGRISVLHGDDLHNLAQTFLPPNTLSGRRVWASFNSIGFRWDSDQLAIIGEWADRKSPAYINSASGWHLTTAYRMGNITPYATIARQNQKRSVIPSGTVMNPVLTLYETTRNPSQKSLTLGVRVELRSKSALKFQWSRIEVPSNAWGGFFPRTVAPGSQPAGKTLDMFSLSIDMVF